MPSSISLQIVSELLADVLQGRSVNEALEDVFLKLRGEPLSYDDRELLSSEWTIGSVLPEISVFSSLFMSFDRKHFDGFRLRKNC